MVDSLSAPVPSGASSSPDTLARTLVTPGRGSSCHEVMETAVDSPSTPSHYPSFQRPGGSPFLEKMILCWLFWAPGASPSLTASSPPASCHASTGTAGCRPSALLGKTLSFPSSFLSFSSFLQPPGPPGPLPLSPYLPQDLTCRCTHGSACS